MNYKIYKNVKLGKKVKIGDYVIIGLPTNDSVSAEYETVIGDYSIIRSHSVIYAGNVIGDNFTTGHNVTIREMNKIGNNVSIGTGTNIEHHIVIEDKVRIHSQAFIPEYTILKNGCWIGPRVVITNAKYPLSPDVKKHLKGATIEANAIIGANAVLLPGITIGQNALIGAGTVVTKDVPSHKVAVGNPMVIIKDISDLPYSLP